MNWDKLAAVAEKIVEETLESLPAEIQPLARKVPLSLESVPSKAMQEEGIADDTLGLFVGESYEDAGASDSPIPGQILLFLENIWDFVEQDIEEYREEVRVTLLHELGHYFGWDERDLLERDLD